MYVNDRSADSICETALEFLAMKSEYMPSHFGGIESTSLVRWVACLYIAGAPVNGEYGWTYRGGWCVVLRRLVVAVWESDVHARVVCRGPIEYPTR
jgi:hypothetical protein